jgi:hypothetical protein
MEPFPTPQKAVMAFIESKFLDRIISRRAETNWPDFNVLYFWFWLFAERQVYQSNPTTFQEVEDAVKDVAASVKADMIRFSVGNLI